MLKKTRLGQWNVILRSHYGQTERYRNICGIIITGANLIPEVRNIKEYSTGA